MERNCLTSMINHHRVGMHYRIPEERPGFKLDNFVKWNVLKGTNDKSLESCLVNFAVTNVHSNGLRKEEECW